MDKTIQLAGGRAMQTLSIVQGNMALALDYPHQNFQNQILPPPKKIADVREIKPSLPATPMRVAGKRDI